MRILVTGASGFAGSLLLPRLLSAGHHVLALSRDPERVDLSALRSRAARITPPPASGASGLRGIATVGIVEPLAADAVSGRGLAAAMSEVDVAYYLIHSMETPGRRGGDPREDIPFPERERLAAENFAAAAADAGVGRIVYLGGPVASWSAPGTNAAASRHLASREAVEHILRASIPDTVVMRASIVIGARSRSFRFLVRLVERMPVLALPRWRSHRTRPIDERDLLEMLATAADSPAVTGRSLDLGGIDVLSYGEMVQRIADLMLVARPSLGLSVSATPIVARVAAAIAAEDPQLTTALMESLQGDLLPGGEHGQAHLRAAELLGVELHSFDSAVEHALREWEESESLAAR